MSKAITPNLWFDGNAKEAVDYYLLDHSAPGAGEVDLATHVNRRRGCNPILQRLRLLNTDGRATGAFQCGEPALLELLLQTDRPRANIHLSITIEDAMRCRYVRRFHSGSRFPVP